MPAEPGGAGVGCTPMLSLLLTTSAGLAAGPSDLWLSTDRLALAVEPGGSLCSPALDLGVLWDPDGPTGERPVGGDLLYQGRAFETWGIAWSDADGDHVLISGSDVADQVDELSWDEPADGADVGTLRGTTTTDSFELVLTIDLPWTDLRDEPDTGLILFTAQLTALEAITDLRLSRSYDPDPDKWSTGSSATANTVDDDTVVAAGEFDGRTVALATSGGQGAICTWCATPDQVLAGSTTGSTADDQLGVAVEIGDLAAGAQVEVVFVYALSLDGETALATARAVAAAPDRDGDLVTEAEGDCDDRDATVGPDQTEVADGVDNDCDGQIDEDTSLDDADGDGFTEADGDCDDDDASVFPGADPVDGTADADCDGVADDGSWPAETPGDQAASDEASTGGCSATRGSPSPALALLGLPALVLRRRDP